MVFLLFLFARVHPLELFERCPMFMHGVPRLRLNPYDIISIQNGPQGSGFHIRVTHFDEDPGFAASWRNSENNDYSGKKCFFTIGMHHVKTRARGYQLAKLSAEFPAVDVQREETKIREYFSKNTDPRLGPEFLQTTEADDLAKDYFIGSKAAQEGTIYRDQFDELSVHYAPLHFRRLSDHGVQYLTDMLLLFKTHHETAGIALPPWKLHEFNQKMHNKNDMTTQCNKIMEALYNFSYDFKTFHDNGALYPLSEAPRADPRDDLIPSLLGKRRHEGSDDGWGVCRPKRRRRSDDDVLSEELENSFIQGGE